MAETDKSEESQERPFSWVMFAALAFMLLALDIGVIFQLSERERTARAQAAMVEEQVRRGASLYVGNCARCHAGDGSGSEIAPGISDIEFLNSVTDDFLKHTIEDGRPRTIMPAWGQESGGPFGGQEVEELVAFIRNWQKPQVEMGRTFTASGLPAGSTEGGRETFAWACAECHGDDGKIPVGAQDIVANSPERLRQMNEQELRDRILVGSGEMPGFESLLSVDEIEGLMKLIATWPR